MKKYYIFNKREYSSINDICSELTAANFIGTIVCDEVSIEKEVVICKSQISINLSTYLILSNLDDISKNKYVIL